MNSPDRRVASPSLVVVMGVAGAGKTTVGQELARWLVCAYADGDQFHSPAAVVKMAAGDPLDDADREPWLAAIGQWLHERRGRGGVVACSALKRRYRDDLRRHAAVGIRFLHLAGGAADVMERVSRRRGHFMPASLVRSQFDDLEPLDADEWGETHNLNDAPERIIRRFLEGVEAQRT